MNHSSLLQGIFLTQVSNLGLLYCRRALYYLSYFLVINSLPFPLLPVSYTRRCTLLKCTESDSQLNLGPFFHAGGDLHCRVCCHFSLKICVDTISDQFLRPHIFNGLSNIALLSNVRDEIISNI